MSKYKSVIAFRNDEGLNVPSVPVNELPVTMNFDQRNIVGKAKLRLGENGEILADIDLFDNSQVLELMKPCVSVCSTNYISSDVEKYVDEDIMQVFAKDLTYKIDGISLCPQNKDEKIKNLKNNI